MKSFGLFLCLTLSAFFAFSQKKAGKTQPIIEVQVSANRTIVRDDNTINGYGFGGGLNIIGSKDRFLNFNFGGYVFVVGGFLGVCDVRRDCRDLPFICWQAQGYLLLPQKQSVVFGGTFRE